MTSWQKWQNWQKFKKRYCPAHRLLYGADVQKNAWCEMVVADEQIYPWRDRLVSMRCGERKVII